MKNESDNVHIIGSVLVECPKCQNKDLILGHKGFFKVAPGKPQGQVLDPQTVFVCASEGGQVCNIFDINEWYAYYKAKESEEPDGTDNV